MINMYMVRSVDGGGFIALMPRPQGDALKQDMKILKERGVGILVSLLEAHEDRVLGLIQERLHATLEGIEFIGHPIPDKGIPRDSDAFLALIASLKERVLEGAGVTVHCWGGIGRSGLLSASILIAMGATTRDALRQVSMARGVQVPETPQQIDWLIKHQTRIRAGFRPDTG